MIAKPDLQHWDSIFCSDHGGALPAPYYVDLALSYRASCKLTSDGKIDLVTRTGGGHGDPGYGLGAIPFHQLRALIDEAHMVGRHYFGHNWGLNEETVL